MEVFATNARNRLLRQFEQSSRVTINDLRLTIFDLFIYTKCVIVIKSTRAKRTGEAKTRSTHKLIVVLRNFATTIGFGRRVSKRRNFREETRTV